MTTPKAVPPRAIAVAETIRIAYNELEIAGVLRLFEKRELISKWTVECESSTTWRVWFTVSTGERIIGLFMYRSQSGITYNLEVS